MIGYINGKLISVADKYIIVDVNGVGYRVAIPEKSRIILSDVGSDVKLYTHFAMNPRDGVVELYGFQTPEELNFFELMTTISGIGPKSAQAILSSTDLQTLQLGIINGNDEYLSKVGGIGPKTAKRLILELKNKVLAPDAGDRSGQDLASEGEAVDALVALGYSSMQAQTALRQLDSKIQTTEEKITEALKILGKK